MFMQLFFILSALLVNVPSTAPTPSPEQMIAAEKKGPSDQNPDVMLIDPAARAKDWVNAYEYLQKHATGKTALFKLRNGQIVRNISNVKALDGGTLLIFTLNTTQGVKYKVAKIEDVDDILQN